MRPVTLVLCTVVGLLPACTRALANGEAPSALEIVVSQNMENGYIYPAGGVGNNDPLVFEATVCPHYALSFGETQSALIFAFKSVVRMYREPSVPVRTPSYMPRFIYYNYVGERNDGISDFYYILASHHSNGQEGSFYNADGSINLVNGGFSTNYLELGFYRYRRPATWGKFWRKFRGGAAVQVHVPLGRDKGLDEVDYGFYRIRYWNRLELRRGTYLSLDSFVILGPLHEAETWDYRRLGGELSLRQDWKLFDGFDLVLSCYVGQDYYNINYTRYLRTLRLGLVTDFGGPSRTSAMTRPHPTSEE